MKIHDRIYCEYCSQEIKPSDSFASFKNYGGEYEHYHRRFSGDCRELQIRREQKEIEERRQCELLAHTLRLR